MELTSSTSAPQHRLAPLHALALELGYLGSTMAATPDVAVNSENQLSRRDRQPSRSRAALQRHDDAVRAGTGDGRASALRRLALGVLEQMHISVRTRRRAVPQQGTNQGKARP
jgi:hypothetical protein